MSGGGDEWPYPPAPGHLGIDHEDRHVGEKCRQQRPVQIGDMVGDDQQPGFVVRVMFPAAQLHPEQPPEQTAGQSLQDVAHGSMHSVFAGGGARPGYINPGL